MSCWDRCVLNIDYTRQFRRDLKKADRNPRHNVEKLADAIDTLAENGTLPPEYRPHALSGNWIPAWECHIQPDFLLIYHIEGDCLRLLRCGSHSELLGR